MTNELASDRREAAKTRLRTRERGIVAVCLCIIAGMAGLSYAAVPLYNIFCRVTGYGGTTQRAEELAPGAIDRVITVRFDANLSKGLAWRFVPVQKELTLKVGEAGLAFFRAQNLTDIPLVGMASYNVTPQKAGVYFTKVQCFCFTEQRLEAGESVDMPVSFFVDPAIAEDENLKDVTTITLSYTFFPKGEATENIAAANRNAAENGMN
jgi:cytochrome c oxidase assembly protein subunit 11